ncbi:ras-related protein RabJ isoform X2 [Megachile rotundata]|nr:PREDICTED: ras-related protein RabJ isoform X2 [Megachile rotundata]XP_012142636.1 PREDICTED: ras-related protein RabJ isoform X2 [Megachile rotundata]XP_012142637.1 PREDICTED: ras-related protein RabJ isoform X2 [Megachile rotundata]XP_012142638.1 PREDICTED: ras-related protein RabJ isoform X2 [Megachile rotundata]
MIIRYVGKAFNEHVDPTIGASFFTCKLNVENVKIMLQVWDTAGQERFRSMAPMYYRNANAAMLVFDLTQYNTFAAMKGWVTELRRNVEDAMVLAVIGNKSDLIKERQVDAEEGRVYATNIGASYHETSVLQDEGIENVFLDIGMGLLRLASTEQDSMSIKIYESTNPIWNGTAASVTPSSEECSENLGVPERPHTCC